MFRFWTLCWAIAASTIVTCPPLDAARKSSTGTQAVYLVTQGRIESAIDYYRQHCQQSGRADYAVLQQMALSILQQGASHKDAECRLIAAFGAGISAHDRATYILAEGLASREPEVALASLHLLAQSQNDHADALIHRAITSENPLVRLEAIFALSKKKHPMASGQAEAMMAKLPRELWFVFPEIYAAIGDMRSTRQLRKLMTEAHEETRVAAVLAAVEAGRDDLLPQIRQISSHLDPKQQEAAAFALGRLGDQNSFKRLSELSAAKDAHTRMAAILALYRLGKLEAGKELEGYARQGSELAISALAEVEGCEDLLSELCQIGPPNVRLNAALVLLQRRDARCLPHIQKILCSDSRSSLFLRGSSRGKTLHAWKVEPAAKLSQTDLPIASALSLKMRETALDLAIELPQGDFLSLAEYILANGQNDLVPRVTYLLENIGNEDATNILKQYQQKVGAPLVRHYCNLSLVRLGEQGPYKEQLMQWIRSESNANLIRFRATVPLQLRGSGDLYELTPEDTSQLLLSALETIAQQQDDESTELLLDVLRDGNPKSRYAIAGLLLRTTQ